MRQDFFEYMPQFKLVVYGNYPPRLRSVNVAMKRRIHVIEFNVVIPEQPDSTNRGAIRKAELRADPTG
jgi:putative DNA primase/helicase